MCFVVLILIRSTTIRQVRHLAGVAASLASTLKDSAMFVGITGDRRFQRAKALIVWLINA